MENVLDGWTFPSPGGLDTMVGDGKENEEKEDNDDKENKVMNGRMSDEGKRESTHDSTSDNARRREKRRRKELKRARERHLRCLGRYTIFFEL